MGFSQTLLDESPTVYLPLDDVAGIAAADVSGNNIHGVYSGNFLLDSHASIVPGGNYAPIFADKGGVYSIGDDDAFNFVHNPAVPTFTLGAWIRIPDITTPDNQMTILASSSFSGEVGFHLYYDCRPVQQNKVGFFITVSGLFRVDLVSTSTTLITAGEWHFVTARCAGSGSIELLVDNVVAASASPSGGTASTNATYPLHAGFNPSSTTTDAYLTGQIAHAFVLPTFLDTADHLAVYESFPPPFLWSFDGPWEEQIGWQFDARWSTLIAWDFDVIYPAAVDLEFLAPQPYEINWQFDAPWLELSRKNWMFDAPWHEGGTPLTWDFEAPQAYQIDWEFDAPWSALNEFIWTFQAPWKEHVTNPLEWEFEAPWLEGHNEVNWRFNARWTEFKSVYVDRSEYNWP